MAESGALKTKQQRAVAALLTAKDLKSAAAQAKVGVRTLQRWLNEDPEFQAALKAAEASTIGVAVRRLTGAADSAITVIMYIVLQQQNPPGVRLRAALGVLELLIRLRELNNLEERMAALEEKFEEGSADVTSPNSGKKR